MQMSDNPILLCVLAEGLTDIVSEGLYCLFHLNENVVGVESLDDLN